MKAVSIRQPWAWAVMAGKKKVGNCDCPTVYLGLLAIHAAKNLEWVPRWVLPDGTPIPPGDQLPFEALLGTVEVVDCVPLEAIRSDPFASGPCCWILANPQLFPEPIPCTGGLGLWTVPTEILAKIPPAGILETISEESAPHVDR